MNNICNEMWKHGNVRTEQLNLDISLVSTLLRQDYVCRSHLRYLPTSAVLRKRYLHGKPTDLMKLTQIATSEKQTINIISRYNMLAPQCGCHGGPEAAPESVASSLGSNTRSLW